MPGRRPSLLDGDYPPPPATYPGATERATPGPAAPARPLHGLAPGEVYPAGRSPDRWWALTPPLHPYRVARGGMFLWHCLEGHPSWALPSTLLCGARTFLGQIGLPAAARPAWATDHPIRALRSRQRRITWSPGRLGHLGTGRSYAGSGWRRVSMPR